MGKTDILAGVVSGITGAATIFLYLTISLPLFFHIPPVALYHLDTSNLIGWQAALHAGLPGIVLGQAAHVCVSLVWGFFFVALLRAFPAMRGAPLGWGIVYGVGVMLFMHFVVVPLGHAPRLSYTPASLLNNLIAHTLFFGVPVAWVATRVAAMRAAARLYP
ncbi:MAG TPA: hypothetical protein VMF11_15010 [Candidatus Baltobacteraceae bacterium]|nr:hypothetical protein [Candidatus Baltobacteraceae bacterium]